MSRPKDRTCLVGSYTDKAPLHCGTDGPYVGNNTLINDIVVNPGLTPDELRACYQQLIDTTEYAGRMFVIETPNPIRGIPPADIHLSTDRPVPHDRRT